MHMTSHKESRAIEVWPDGYEKPGYVLVVESHPGFQVAKPEGISCVAGNSRFPSDSIFSFKANDNSLFCSKS